MAADSGRKGDKWKCDQIRIDERRAVAFSGKELTCEGRLASTIGACNHDCSWGWFDFDPVHDSRLPDGVLTDERFPIVD